MSKIGKKPIQLADKVTLEVNLPEVQVKGPKGELVVVLPEKISVEVNDGIVVVKPDSEDRRTLAFWGLSRSLVANAVEGVTEGFEKELELVGVGYRVQKKGTGLELEVGYSHKVDFDAPEGVTLEVDKGVIKVSGIDKQKVGQAAANIRAVRPPEPYKGKGIRFVGEEVQLKPGKSAKVGAA